MRPSLPALLPLQIHASTSTDVGLPAAFFSITEIKVSRGPLQYTLITNTPRGRPPFSEILFHLALAPASQDWHAVASPATVPVKTSPPPLLAWRAVETWKKETLAKKKFLKCEYPKLKLFKTEGSGCGLLADEDIKAGQFVIEYCGEVISWKKAKRRSQVYEAEGRMDAYIISLNASESIDATKKGSLARFINHSCQPNCETRKLTVLGEIRVGIFAKQDIPAGTELAYDYNFEWYGGVRVRCLCGAASCSGFLGAKSRGFQEAFYLWEDDDTRFSVDDIPLYDSGEDEPPPKFLEPTVSNMLMGEGDDYYMRNDDGVDYDSLQPTPIAVVVPDEVQTETGEDKLMYSQETNQFTHNAMISRIRSNSACRNYHIEPSPSSKRFARYSNGKTRTVARKQVNVKLIAERLASLDACQELLAFEEMKNEATSQLDSLYEEIRPAIEEHERDSQDSVSTNVGEKWIEASCRKLKADFDLYSAIIKSASCIPKRSGNKAVAIDESDENGIKYLEMNQ